MCIVIIVIIYYFFLVIFLSMLGMVVYYFISIMVIYYVMYVVNNFKFRFRVYWFFLGVWGKLLYKCNLGFGECFFWYILGFFLIFILCYEINLVDVFFEKKY